MNKVYSLLIVLQFLPNTLFAQDSTTTNSSLTTLMDMHMGLNDSSYISLYGNAGLATTFLSNSLVQNDYWSAEIIDNQVEKLNDFNRLGGFLESELTYVGRSSKISNSAVKFQPIFGIGHQSFTSFKIQRELLGLIFKGNKNYSNISVSPTSSFEDQSFSYVKFGIAHFNSSKQTKNEFGLNILGGHKYTFAKAENGSVITDSSSRNISFNDVLFELESSQNSSFSDFGVSVYYDFTTRIKDKNIFKLSVKNLGVISAKNNRTLILNKTVQYSGFNISENIKTSSSFNVEDSINSNYFDSDTSNVMRITPFQLSAEYVYFINSDKAVKTKLNYLKFTGYLPLLETDYYQAFGNNRQSWNVGAKIGGFGTYALNLGVSIPFSSHSLLSIQLAGVEAFASNNIAINWYGNFGITIGL